MRGIDGGPRPRGKQILSSQESSETAIMTPYIQCHVIVLNPHLGTDPYHRLDALSRKLSVDFIMDVHVHVRVHVHGRETVGKRDCLDGNRSSCLR